MNRDGDRSRIFSRRAAILGGGKILLLSTLAARLYYLQVIEAERYATLAEENRINLRLLPPRRGRIVDRFGEPLATNQLIYQVVVVPEQTPDIEATLASLGTIIEIGEGEKRRVLREIRRKRSFVPIMVRDNLSWEEVAAIEVNAPDLPGVSIDVGETRMYPFAGSLAHVIGYVGQVTENEMTGYPVLMLPSTRIGKSGIEKAHDKQLRGRGGTSQVEVNAFGRIIRELRREEGQLGSEVTLTLDYSLQRFVVRRLEEQIAAAAVVLDPNTGDVLSLASVPSFDPNAFNRGMSSEEWRGLSTNPGTPLLNKAIAGLYSPGSTIKMMVALAALEAGVITTTTRVLCNGKVELGDATFHCWRKHGHGWLDPRGAIVNSCDVFFYEAARRLGIDRLAAMGKRFGFGKPTSLDIPGELGGVMPTRAWKAANVGGPWHVGETLIAGIGQGYMLTTPMQLAVMASRIANGGFAVEPRLTRRIVDHNGVEDAPERTFESLGLQPANLKLVFDAMVGVMNEQQGTAYRSRITERGFEMAGKTGTSQVRRISKAERQTKVRTNESLEWAERDHAVFVGFAPVSAPRYVCAVLVEHGGGGSAVAAPIARDILLEAQRLDRRREGAGGQVSTLPVPPSASHEGG
ncbi:MAG: penicillin-binding protein 2 [Rhodospirillales bacterium]|nr:penicillin-binding protein 2 [Rhodospirillales bacterium]